MDDNEYRNLASELDTHLRNAVLDFMRSKNIAYNIQAFIDQSATKCDDLALDILMFGANLFPHSATDDAMAMSA